MLEFLIVGLGRSGSTSLCAALNILEPGSCMVEPFNPALYGGRYHRTALESGLGCALAAVRSQARGVKHVVASGGWPFPGQPDLNDELCSKMAGKVVLLNRRNLLQRMVSDHIGRHSGVWHVRDAADRHRRRDAGYPPLAVSDVKRRLEADLAVLGRIRRLLGDSGVEWREVFFEAIFEAKVGWPRRFMGFREFATFLGYVCEPRREADLVPILNREPCDLSASIYHLVPNLDEIDKALASPIAGSILSGPWLGY